MSVFEMHNFIFWTFSWFNRYQSVTPTALSEDCPLSNNSTNGNNGKNSFGVVLCCVVGTVLPVGGKKKVASLVQGI